ncbi:MAG: AbrB/MazE/SpoVT family DNA-binding domain-containing protein [Ktedonobacteraceae bacterium]
MTSKSNGSIPTTFVATVQERGQITLPVPLRKALGLKFKNRVSVSLHGAKITIEPMKRTLEEALGSYKAPSGMSVDNLIENSLAQRAEEIKNIAFYK